MTLQQLKYITLVAEKGNITDAAKALYISQPSLTAAIKELEKEMNIQIFDRTNKGVHVSKEGDLFFRLCATDSGAGLSFGGPL